MNPAPIPDDLPTSKLPLYLLGRELLASVLAAEREDERADRAARRKAKT